MKTMRWVRQVASGGAKQNMMLPGPQTSVQVYESSQRTACYGSYGIRFIIVWEKKENLHCKATLT